MKKILLLLVILLLLLNFANAKTKSEPFIDHATELIYSDCEGKNIESYIILARKVEWPYNKEELRSFIAELSKYDFKEHDVNTTVFKENKLEGIGVLKCGENTLNIYGRTFFWKGVEITPPSNSKIITEKSILKIGNISFSLFGGISIISISIISITIISLSIILLIRKKKISFNKYELVLKKK